METVPRKGVIVAEISEKEILEVFTILSSLEVLAAKLTIEKLDDETIGKYEEYIKKVEESLQNEGGTDYSALHKELNYVIYSTARNAKLYEMLSGLSDIYERSQKLAIRMKEEQSSP